MSDQRVSMFISHKVALHRRAAERIKAILQSRTERLDVHISEEIHGGELWKKWITDRIAHSNILLVLLPSGDTDLSWVTYEIGNFTGACPDGRRIVLKLPSIPVSSSAFSSIISDTQIIEASKDQLQEHFLQPLYRCSTFVGLDTPLNARVTDVDLNRDSEEVEDALRGIVYWHSKAYRESLVVETAELDITTPSGLDDALVRAPNGCSKILNWALSSFSWKELQTRASEDKGRGTFWVDEMGMVIKDVVVRHDDQPRIMTSTLRGRGKDVAGLIFKPQLETVDFVDQTPVRYHFAFHEVLVPELVRGSEPIGDVYNLLYVTTRVRWEVLNPFLVQKIENDTPPSRLNISQEEQLALLGQVSRSLRIIEVEVERHNMLEAAIKAFEGDDRNIIIDLLQERAQIKSAIEDAAKREDFTLFMERLMRRLELNCEATELLAKRFLQLAHKDQEDIQQMLQRTRLKEVELK